MNNCTLMICPSGKSTEGIASPAYAAAIKLCGQDLDDREYVPYSRVVRRVMSREGANEDAAKTYVKEALDRGWLKAVWRDNTDGTLYDHVCKAHPLYRKNSRLKK